MKDPIRVLVAEDDRTHREMLARTLRSWGYSPVAAPDGQAALELYRQQMDAGTAPGMALLDMRMPGLDGQSCMRELKAVNESMPVILMTAYSEIPAAVEAIRSGAFDYLTKPLDFAKLEITLRNAAAQLALVRENASLSQSLSSQKGIVWGCSRAMKEVEKLIRTIAPTEAHILIGGESGTGKELAARAIHDLSNRKSGPFVAINCGALTETLLASELFGHEKGAFTGADRRHEGLFLAAAGGSIFLDEIGEMPLPMQVKLLRVLQEKEVLSVGGKKARPLNCRVLAATNRDLAEEVRKGAFREDLYYRLNVVPVTMPPLREHLDDLPALAINFATRYAKQNHKIFSGISTDAMHALESYHWPGNVRELENIMERAVILMPGESIGARELPDRLRNHASGSCSDSAHMAGTDEGCPTLEEVERAAIIRTLQKFANNKTEAARALGISRKTLHAKLNRYAGKTDDQEGC